MREVTSGPLGYAAGTPVACPSVSVCEVAGTYLLAEFSVHTGYRVTPDSRFPVVVALAASLTSAGEP